MKGDTALRPGPRALGHAGQGLDVSPCPLFVLMSIRTGGGSQNSLKISTGFPLATAWCIGCTLCVSDVSRHLLTAPAFLIGQAGSR